MFEEYRREVAAGRIELAAEDFVTAFHRRVFEAIMRQQAGEDGFRFAMLGEEFTPDEMGRIRKMEVARRELTENGPSVFRSTVETLRNIRNENRAKEGDLQSRLEYLRKSKLHKGKEQSE